MGKRGMAGAIMSAMGLRDHEALVTEVETLTPTFLRVRLISPTLFTDAEVGPTAFLRFWFPDPDDPDTEHQRGYTITEADPEAGTFAVDFVLHEPAGPASAWAETVTPGTRIEVASMGSHVFSVPEELPAGYLLIGDAASIPAISSILETVPAEVPIEVYLEEHAATDREIPLAGHPRARLHWVPRRGEGSLAAALESRDWSDWTVWAAPESGSLKHLRTRLRNDFGFPKSEITARAYWYFGRPFGSRRGKVVEEAHPAEVVVDGSAPDPQQAPPAEPATASAPKGSWRSDAGRRLIAPLAPTFWVAGVAQGLVTLVELAPFVLLVELSRQLLTGAEAATLWATGGWAVVLMGTGVLLSTALLFWLHLVDARFGRDLRQRLLDTLARLPLGWFVDRGSGRIKQLVTDDTLSLHYLVTHAVLDAVAAALAPFAVLVYLFVVDWRIASALLVPVLVYVVTTYLMVVQSGSKPGQAMRWSERMNVEAGDYLTGQPIVRVFGGAQTSRFRARLEEYVRFLDEWQRPFISAKTVMDLATRPATFLLLIAVLGTVLISGGAMDPVDLLPFLFLGTTFGSRLLGIGYGLSGLSTGLLASRRIQNALDEEQLSVRAPAPDADVQAAPSATSAGSLVEFDHVGFAYRPGSPVITDVSARLAPGSVTALVGPSGSGKSTLAALLARFHDVDAGAIRIDGRDIRELGTDELYSRVGFVFQDPQLIHGTVRENIALAVPEAGDAEVEAAARAAQIHDRITRLPERYDTVLGPDAALSGGERQRLSIARALLADTPVLVLDEATAFADPESEHRVQQALARLTVGRTVLVIAHRLHTITDVDRILVLDHGSIAEAGTHSQLMRGTGRYRRLWDAREPASAAQRAAAQRTAPAERTGGNHR